MQSNEFRQLILSKSFDKICMTSLTYDKILKGLNGIRDEDQVELFVGVLSHKKNLVGLYHDYSGNYTWTIPVIGVNSPQMHAALVNILDILTNSGEYSAAKVRHIVRHIQALPIRLKIKSLSEKHITMDIQMRIEFVDIDGYKISAVELETGDTDFEIVYVDTDKFLTCINQINISVDIFEQWIRKEIKETEVIQNDDILVFEGEEAREQYMMKQYDGKYIFRRSEDKSVKYGMKALQFADMFDRAQKTYSVYNFEAYRATGVDLSYKNMMNAVAEELEHEWSLISVIAKAIKVPIQKIKDAFDCAMPIRCFTSRIRTNNAFKFINGLHTYAMEYNINFSNDTSSIVLESAIQETNWATLKHSAITIKDRYEIGADYDIFRKSCEKLKLTVFSNEKLSRDAITMYQELIPLLYRRYLDNVDDQINIKFTVAENDDKVAAFLQKSNLIGHHTVEIAPSLYITYSNNLLTFIHSKEHELQIVSGRYDKMIDPLRVGALNYNEQLELVRSIICNDYVSNNRYYSRPWTDEAVERAIANANIQFTENQNLTFNYINYGTITV